MEDRPSKALPKIYRAVTESALGGPNPTSSYAGKPLTDKKTLPFQIKDKRPQKN